MEQQGQEVSEENRFNPLLTLEFVLGFSGHYCPDLKWSRLEGFSNELMYAAGSLIIAYDVKTKK